jgi:23S rRNA (uracil1939-C5)-methyltransferase
MARRRRNRLPQEPVEVTIESLDHEGRGIAHIDGKTLFVDGALPGETVNARYTQKRRRFDQSRTVEVLKASDKRIEAKCPHFGVCGGCSLQHMSHDAQVELKQNVLLELFEHVGKLEVPEVLPPLTDAQWQYRRKARLGARYVEKKEKLMVGFRERYGRYLADMSRCEVLHESVGERIEALQVLIRSLNAYKQIAQIEVAVGDNATALVFRNLEELVEDDRRKLRQFADDNDVQVWLQPGGPDTVAPLWPDQIELYYELPEYAVRMDFLPTDFTQVNAGINRKMIPYAIELLELQPEHKLLDLFCGLGNFSLPLARQVSHVTGVEGDEGLVERAHQNAEKNGVTNVDFMVADLFKGVPSGIDSIDRLLLDPPRSGALEIVSEIEKLSPQRIVYVSCNPSTLARDAGVLVNDKGYKLLKAGIMDMFPHTAHAEAIAVFEKG